jgi:fibronectin type 3 domain-containing protein
VPVVVLAILFSGIVGVVIFRVAADQKVHSVLLKWNPPQSKPGISVASYDVYRTQGDGTFVKIASGLTNPTYVDRDVSSGKTYRYFVRAIDASGNVSPPSDQASAKIP